MTIITIIQCVSANTTTYHLLGAGANQSCVNTMSTQCQAVSTSIKLPVPSRCQKSSFQLALQGKWLSAAFDSESQILDQSLLQALLGRTVLGLFQFNLLLAVYQSSSSDSHCRLKSLKVKADLCLDKVRFLCMAHSGTILFAVNTSGMGKEGRKAQASPWCFYFQHLAIMATPRTGQLWPKCFIK